MIFRITAPHFCAGGVLANERVTECAPIINYMDQWALGAIRMYCGRKGWQLETTEEEAT